ncbi:hypothetical protein VQE80_06525 [Staphylococcus shinii]|uniref:hypothetical protein n=1 Tax=Staphylococcus shinii TaxID=2912228 RepID=UPI0028825E4A
MKDSILQWENLKYRICKTSNWEKVREWMKFFLLIGEYIDKKDKINIYISYLDEFYPALFIAKGVIDSNLSSIECRLRDYDINNDLKIGDNVTYLVGTEDGKDIWKKAVVINIYNDENAVKKEWNPYVELKFEKKKKNEFNHKIPRTIWSKKLRISSNYKNTAGSVVKMNKEIDGYFKDKYSKQVLNHIQGTNKKQINIIGSKVQKEWESYNEFLEFSEDNIEYKISDFIFANDSQYSISNVNFIKTINSKSAIENNIPTVFVGDNSALTLSKLKTGKNVILSNRKKYNDTLSELVKQNVLNDLIFEHSQIDSKELHNFLNENNVKIPKGVEIFVY